MDIVSNAAANEVNIVRHKKVAMGHSAPKTATKLLVNPLTPNDL
jgi:hypothetical protein